MMNSMGLKRKEGRVGAIVFAIVFSFAGCTATGGKEPAVPDDLPDAELDGAISIQKIQVFGTHNSYHLLPGTDVIEEWNYEHLPLDQQLDNGIRQFEIDVVYEPDSGELLVQHIPVLDNKSNCYSFLDCMETLSEWSEAHPEHVPIHVLVEPRTEIPAWSTSLHLDTVDDHISSVFGDRVWTPAKQQGSHLNLRESVVASGFPVLEELRGGFIFVLLDGGEPYREYTNNGASLTNRMMFPLVEPAHEWAAYFLRDNPFATDISSLSEMGFLIRTRADAGGVFDSDRFEAAISGQANALSMDTAEALAHIDQSFPFRIID